MSEELRPSPATRTSNARADPSVEDWTLAAHRYWDAAKRTVDFVAFTAQLVDRGDAVTRIASSALAAGETDQEEKARLESAATATPLADKFAEWRPFLSEVVLCRSVDNFLTYIADALLLVFTQRPEALRSGEQVRVDFVLQYSTMDDVLAALAERRVDRLAYKGLRDMAADLTKSLNLSLFPDAEVEAKATTAVDERNLIVHNRGVINTRWIARHGTTDGNLGDALRLGNPIDTLDVLSAIVRHVDRQLADKFGVQQTRTFVLNGA